MEMQSELFIRGNAGTPPEGPAKEEHENDSLATKPVMDPELLNMLASFVHTFHEVKEEIEVKGMLIDFIRKI